MSIDDLRLFASLLDFNQFFSRLVGHFLENVKEINSFLDSNVHSKVGFTLSEEPLELRLGLLVVNKLESIHFEVTLRLLCEQKCHKQFTPQDWLNPCHCDDFLVFNIDAGKSRLKQIQYFLTELWVVARLIQCSHPEIEHFLPQKL